MMITIKHNKNDMIAVNKTHIMLNECALFNKDYFNFNNDILNKVIKEYKEETFYNITRGVLYPDETKSLIANGLNGVNKDIRMSNTYLMSLTDSKNKPVYYIGNAETKDKSLQVLRINKRYSDLLENFSIKYYADNGFALAVANGDELIAYVKCITMIYRDDLLFNLTTEINSHRYAIKEKTATKD